VRDAVVQDARCLSFAWLSLGNRWETGQTVLVSILAWPPGFDLCPVAVVPHVSRGRHRGLQSDPNRVQNQYNLSASCRCLACFWVANRAAKSMRYPCWA